MMNSTPDVLYICDGKQCEKCSNVCYFTTDISHAKNFTLVKKDDGSKYYIETLDEKENKND